MKKAISLFLTIVLVLCTVSLASFAAEAKSVLPVIDMRGFMHSQIYSEKDNPDSTRLFPPETNAFLAFARRLLPSITRFRFYRNWDLLGDTLIPALNELLLPVASDENGDAKGKTGPLFTYPSKAEIAENPDVSFIYDWRDDPFVSASQLNDFVNYVADDCGYGKVALECHSYGGLVTLSYLATYGTEKVESVCFNATAVYGAAFAGELMQGKVNLSVDGLAAFLEGLIDQTEYEGLLRGLITIFDDLGGLNFLCDFINELFENLSSRIWKESIVPVFGSWLSVWDMVPDDKLDAGKAFIKKTGVTYNDTFLARTGRYDAEIRTKREPLLREINNRSNLYVIARYGYAGVPLGGIWTANSDGVLTTQAESFGATCDRFDIMAAPNLETMPMISPNGAIDASTCLFPNQTWFIRNCKHVEHDPLLKEFTGTLLRAKGQQTVKSFKEYPQFLLLEKNIGALLPDDGLIRSPRKWQDDVLKMFKMLMERIKEAVLRPFKRLQKIA